MRFYLLSLTTIIVLFSCKEGDVGFYREKNFTTNQGLEFSQPEFNSFAELESWLYANSEGNFIKQGSGSQAYVTINSQAVSLINLRFQYVDCFLLPLSITDRNGEVKGIVYYEVIIANNTRSIDSYPESLSVADFGDLLYAWHILPNDLGLDNKGVTFQNSLFAVLSNNIEIKSLPSGLQVDFYDQEADMFILSTEDWLEASISGQMICSD